MTLKLEKKPILEGVGKRLRLAVTLCGLKLSIFGKKYNLALSNLYAIEKGERDLTKNLATRIAYAIKQEGYYCSIEWLLSGKGVPPCQLEEISQSKIVNLPTELSKLTCSLSPEIKLMQEIGFFQKLYASSLVTGIFDDSMEPFYFEGDYVGGIVNYVSFELLIEKHCIIELSNHIKVVRQLKRGNQPGTYNLFCVNPSTKNSEPVLFNQKPLSVTPIVWHRKP